MYRILEKIKQILPNQRDDQETKFFKLTVFLIIGLFFIMVFMSVIIFFANLRGNENVSVPNVTSSENDKVDLIDAIARLQDKGLNVRIQEKHTSEYSRGIVIGQNYKPGKNVKIGRTVTLVVSKGPVIKQIEDYTGKTLGWLRYELLQAFASDEMALLQIREPVMYVYDEATNGTILEQNPKEGTPLYENRVTYIDLVVSKGPKGQEVIAEKYIGKRYQDAIKLLAGRNIPFLFEIEKERNEYKEGIVATQNPEPDKEIPLMVPMRLTVNEITALEDDEVFDIFNYIIDDYPVPVTVKVIARYMGEEMELLSIKHDGGKISFPYRLKSGTEIIVYILDKEVNKYLVEKEGLTELEESGDEYIISD
ncbi:MAG: PASTA domain-containing protein [Spirochaetales bacterium]|nr:PASTA domain-containing protein [Spirochaetales bacterium]